MSGLFTRTYLLRRWLGSYFAIITTNVVLFQSWGSDPIKSIAFGLVVLILLSACVIVWPIFRQIFLIMTAVSCAGTGIFTALTAFDLVGNDWIGIAISFALGAVVLQILMSRNWGAWIGWQPTVSIETRLTSHQSATKIWSTLIVASNENVENYWPHTFVSVEEKVPGVKVFISAFGNGAFQSVTSTDVTNTFPTTYVSHAFHSLGTFKDGAFQVQQKDFLKLQYNLQISEHGTGLTQIDSKMLCDKTPTNTALFYWLDDFGGDMACSMKAHFDGEKDWSLLHATLASGRAEAARLRGAD